MVALLEAAQLEVAQLGVALLEVAQLGVAQHGGARLEAPSLKSPRQSSPAWACVDLCGLARTCVDTRGLAWTRGVDLRGVALRGVVSPGVLRLESTSWSRESEVWMFLEIEIWSRGLGVRILESESMSLLHPGT